MSTDAHRDSALVTIAYLVAAHLWYDACVLQNECATLAEVGSSMLSRSASSMHLIGLCVSRMLQRLERNACADTSQRRASCPA